MFTKLYGWNVWGSNYGRAIVLSTFGNHERLRLRKEKLDKNGHIQYVFTKPLVFWNGKLLRGPMRLSISAHRLCAELFLPDGEWNLRRNQMQAHHCDHIKTNNAWWDLCFCPVYVHRWFNYIETYWVQVDREFVQKKNPYEVMNVTGLTMEEIAYAVRRDPDWKTVVNDM